MSAPNPYAASLAGWERFRRAHLYDYNPASTRLWLAMVLAGALALAYAAWAMVGATGAEGGPVVAEGGLQVGRITQ